MERFLLALPLQFRIADYTDHIWSVIIGALFVMLMVFLIGQFIELIDKYNRTKPVVWEENGRRLEIPADKWQQLPAAAARDIIRVMTQERKSEKSSVVEEDIEEVETVSLPDMSTGHVLVVGETGAGKTTAMKAIIRNRNNVVVLDPHDSPGEWPNVQVIGAGRNFAAIQDYLSTMQNELKNRFDQRARGYKNFEPLTVVTDEMPAIVSEIGKDFGITWRSWIREGRKVGLFIIMGSQSTRVETIGIRGEGDLLENFNYIITLGKQAQTTYKDLVEGMDRPAVIHSVNGIFPVTIPYMPNSYRQNLYVAQEPSVIETPGIDSEWGYISGDQVDTILRMKREGASGRSIEESVIGYTGGHAYNMVRLVLEKHGAT